MQVFRLYSDSLDGHFIDEAVRTLQAGEIIIYPTDTLYALGCDATNRRAIERLCRLKKLNPDKNTLSIVCNDLSCASEYARIDNKAFRIMKQYLPGPFTFILPASSKLPKEFKDRNTVGVRIPDSAVARALSEALGNPLLTSSVNAPDPDDESSVAVPALLKEYYSHDVALLIDAGEGGTIPSTVVDLTDSSNPEVVRSGCGIFD